MKSLILVFKIFNTILIKLIIILGIKKVITYNKVYKFIFKMVFNLSSIC